MFFAEMYFIIDPPLCCSHRAELLKTFENKSKLLYLDVYWRNVYSKYPISNVKTNTKLSSSSSNGISSSVLLLTQ